MDGRDLELAERTVRRLAAVTDAELVAGIRAALGEVVDLAEVWRRAADWRRATTTERRAYDSALRAVAALAELGEHPPVRRAVEVVEPVLGCWWPDTSPPAAAAAGAVERLRAAAMHRPELVRHCRQLTAG